MGARTVRGISAFRPSDQTRGAIANSALIASSSTAVAPSGEMEPPSTPATLSTGRAWPDWPEGRPGPTLIGPGSGQNF